MSLIKNILQEDVNIILTAIKTERVKRELSQYDLAHKLNISQNTYFKIEKGQSKLDIYRLLQIASLLELDLPKILSTTSIYSKANV